MTTHPGRWALAVVCLALASTFADGVAAQGLGGGIRGGLGVDRMGETVFGGQVELVDFGRTSSVELALAATHGSQIEDYRRSQRGSRLHEYHEETRAVAIGVLANWLIRNSQASRGLYVVLGLGISTFDVDWRVESPTDVNLGTPGASGGSYDTEQDLTFGSTLNVGVGVRIARRVDIRMQALTMLVPSTDKREDMKVLPALTLALGLGL